MRFKALLNDTDACHQQARYKYACSHMQNYPEHPSTDSAACAADNPFSLLCDMWQAYLQGNALAPAVSHQVCSLQERRQLNLIHGWHNCGCFQQLFNVANPKIRDSNIPHATLYVQSMLLL